MTLEKRKIVLCLFKSFPKVNSTLSEEKKLEDGNKTVNTVKYHNSTTFS